MLNELPVENRKGGGKVGVSKQARPLPAPEDDESGVAVWEPRERRTEQFNTKITKTLKKGLDEASALLTHVQRAKDQDPKAEVSLAEIAERALSNWLDSFRAESGIQPTSTPEELEHAKIQALQFYLRLSRDAAAKASKEVARAVEEAAKEAKKKG